MRALFLLALLQLEPLAREHEDFLAEQAHFLLSSREREAFMALRTGEERENFIGAFWSRHDREAHEARLRESDTLYGPRGRHSERGRLHQLLGPPATRERFGRARGELVPVELWLYRGMTSPVLPESFYILLYRRSGAGDFRVWSPAADGLRALLPDADPQSLSDERALERLRDLDPELALAASELVPGAGAPGAQSLVASLGGLEDLLERDRILTSQVAATAAVRSLPAHLTVSVWPDDVGVLEMHYALELDASAMERLPWRDAKGRRRVSVRLLARATGDGPERLWDDEIVLEGTARVARAPQPPGWSFQGRQLLRGHEARLQLVLLSGDALASAETTIAPTAFLARRAPAEGAESLPFRGVVPIAGRPVGGSSVVVAAPFEDAAAAEVEWTVWRDGAPSQRRVRSHGALALLELELPDAPGEIRARAVRGAESREVRFAAGAPGRSPLRVIARERTADEARAYRMARSLALAAAGELSSAVAELPRDDGRAHVALARSLYRERRFAGLLASLTERAPECAEPDLFVLLAASAASLGRYELAVSHYERALDLSPDSAGIRSALQAMRARLP